MKKIVWLYAESEFTPWKEMVDTRSMIELLRSVTGTYKSTLMHYIDAKDQMAEIIESYDLVFNCCFGFQDQMQYEIAGWLDSLTTPHTAPNRQAQELAQDKLVLNKLSGISGVNVPKAAALSEFDPDELIICKPRFGSCHQDISIGRPSEVRFHHNGKEMLYQKYLSGREFTVSIIPSQDLSNYVSYIGEIIPIPHRDIYIAGLSFGRTTLNCEIDLPENLKQHLSTISIEIHKKFDLFAFSRIDFRFSDDAFYVLDVNSMPNLHYQYSFTPRICAHNGVNLQDLMQRIIEFSLHHRKKCN